MAEGQVRLDFSDMGGRRVWPPEEMLGVSDIGGQKSGEAEPQDGYFSQFGDLGPLSVENHPEWLTGGRESTGSQQPHDSGAGRISSQPTKPLDFSDLGGRRISPPLSQSSQQRRGLESHEGGRTNGTPGQEVQPRTPQKSTLEQLLDLNDAISAAGMRTVVGAGKDLWETAKGFGSLVKPPDFMLHPIQQRPRTLGEAISKGAQAGAYGTGLTTLGRAAKAYYDATRQNIQRAEQAADKGDAAGVLINSAAAGLPLVGPLIGGLYEDAQTNDLPTMAGKGISRIGQAMSMAPEKSFIPNPVTTVAKDVVRALSKTGDDAGVPTGTAEAERPPKTDSTRVQRGRIAGSKDAKSTSGRPSGTLPSGLQRVLKKINPTADRYNCGRCADALAQTLNGNESIAEEGWDIQAEHLEDKYGRFVDATIPEIEKELLADGEGSHAIVKGEYQPGPDGKAEGHVFNAVHWNDGKVYFVDPQSGTAADLSTFRRFQSIRPD